jgi:hypothetical protein
MDLTNARSMELFRSLGLADKLREQGPLRIRFGFDRELTFRRTISYTIHGSHFNRSKRRGKHYRLVPS